MTENQFRVGILGGFGVLWLLTLLTYWTNKPVEVVEQQALQMPCVSQLSPYGDTNIPILPARNPELLSQHIAETYWVKPQLANNIVQTVYAHTDSTDFPGPVLVLAVMAIESSFRPDVISYAGALGLMQVKPVHNPGTTIEDNILTGIWVLQKYRMRVSTDVGAIMAYNIGITAFKSGRTNDKYVDKVVAKQLEFNSILRY